MFLIWRQSTVAMVTSCEDSALVVLPDSTFRSCWGVWWMTLSITLLTLSPPRGSYGGGLRFNSLLAWALLWSSVWTISVRLPESSLWGRFILLLMPLIHASRLWGKRWQTWRVVVSVFFPALVDPAVLEINFLFLGFVDDDVFPPPPLCFPFLTTLSSALYVSCSTFLASLIWMPQFGFVTMMLHFVTAFAIAIT